MWSLHRVINDFFNNKMIGILLVIIYADSYDYITKTFLFKNFSYLLDYDYHPVNYNNYIFYLVICSFPFFFYKGIKFLASIMSLFYFILIYIPTIHTLFVGGYPEDKTILFISFFFITMCVFFITDSCMIWKNFFYNKERKISFFTYEVICLILFILLIYYNIENIRFVNFLEDKQLMYELRENNYLTRSSLNNYLCIWMNHVFIPILMVCYLKEKKHVKLVLAFIAMLIMYTIDMQKISFIIPFIIVILYYLYHFFSQGFRSNIHTFLLLSFIILPYVAIRFSEFSDAAFAIAALFIMRTQCVEGREFATYFDFFEIRVDHPYTYFSHIGIVNSFTNSYPYFDSLGRTVSYGDGNANANFMLMDGIASGGLLGCIIISIIFLIFKTTFNSIGNKFDVGMCMIIFIFPIASMINVSLFTTLFTGGYIVFYVILLFVNFKQLQQPK